MLTEKSESGVPEDAEAILLRGVRACPQVESVWERLLTNMVGVISRRGEMAYIRVGAK